MTLSNFTDGENSIVCPNAVGASVAIAFDAASSTPIGAALAVGSYELIAIGGPCWFCQGASDVSAAAAAPSHYLPQNGSRLITVSVPAVDGWLAARAPAAGSGTLLCQPLRG